MNIDTAVETASVCLARGRTIVGFEMNSQQKDHAAWLHPAIEAVLKGNQLSVQDLSAVAVSEGPGSYTGLRVGMAAAKGLCYAMNIPLIGISTLAMMASAALEAPTELVCPMIDARRNEVFTAVFDKKLNIILPPANLILDEESFGDLLQTSSITFFGNGSVKFQKINSKAQALFSDYPSDAKNMVLLSLALFEAREFRNLAYAEPFYGKEFHSPKANNLA